MICNCFRKKLIQLSVYTVSRKWCMFNHNEFLDLILKILLFLVPNNIL